MLLIDWYAYNNKLTPVHPGEKFIFFALTMTVCLGLPSVYTSLAIVILMAGVILWGAGVPWRFYLKLLFLPAVFLVVGVIAVAVTVNRDSHNLLWSINLGAYAVGLSQQGLDNAITLFGRSLAAVSCMYFLCLTTPMNEIIDMLKKIRLPDLVVELITLIYRFIFILIELAGRIFAAQASRLGYRDARTGLGSLSQLVLSLFIKSYRQSQFMFDTLASRCYNGQIHFIGDKRNWSPRNLLFITLIEGALLICSLYAGGLL